MRKIFATATATAAVAGVLALGLAAPAQAATNAQATTASSATKTTHYDFKIWSPKREGYLLGRIEGGFRKKLLRAEIVDTTNGPREYTFAEVRYFNTDGKRRFYRTKTLTSKAILLKVHFIRDIDVRVCEGNLRETECGDWVDLY